VREPTKLTLGTPQDDDLVAHQSRRSISATACSKGIASSPAASASS
jgi:hypothetical protein